MESTNTSSELVSAEEAKSRCRAAWFWGLFIGVVLSNLSLGKIGMAAYIIAASIFLISDVYYWMRAVWAHQQ
jgi:hypothetical protein